MSEAVKSAAVEVIPPLGVIVIALSAFPESKVFRASVVVEPETVTLGDKVRASVS